MDVSTTRNAAAYYRYWGKALPSGGTGAEYHLLVYHSLDVAAVGSVLLERFPALTQALASSLGLSPHLVRTWAVYFLALHDIGKFAASFQDLAPDVRRLLQGQRISRGYPTRHDTLGYAFWRERLSRSFGQRNPLKLPESARDYDRGFRVWAATVFGHHGKPPENRYRDLRESFLPEDIEAAEAFAADVEFLLEGTEPVDIDPDVFEDAVCAVSWWLAGVAVLADWLGSSQHYFRYEADPSYGLSAYWARAVKQARVALDDSHALPVSAGPDFGLGRLLPAGAHPTSLQGMAADMPLEAEPQLFILEDLTGSGKTEAAIMLAHRLMRVDQADGLFFGLPTMATANAMFGRIRDVHPLLFESPAQASLVLAHSQRSLIGDFEESIMRSPPPEAELERYEEETASARCAAWLADNTKKALLASVGIGTIDQALMAVLHSRHQSMRLLGLFRKVLIVDEVHANDAYMHRLLCILLRFHAAAGGSAILLSATLPQRMRAELCEAFAQGRNVLDVSLPATNEYPLLTHWRPEGVEVEPLTASARATRDVEIAMIHDVEDVVTTIVSAAEAGRCVCWIRNTVDDARGAAEMLRAATNSPVMLFHARFMMGDRLDIERGVSERFGKNSTAEERHGRVLVATQVVEQSLDLDFDVLVTDLAPVDLVIQRAGRLHRHPRKPDGTPKPEGDDEREPPVMHVFGPVPQQNAPEDWIRSVLPGTGAVYPNHAALWRTAHLLGERGRLSMPADARPLIEGVFGDEDTCIPAPQALQETELQVSGQEGGDRSIAEYNGLTFEEGYCAGSQRWFQETQVPTRLGQPTSRLCLMSWDGENLEPLYRGETAHPWQMSQVSVRRYQVAEESTDVDPKLSEALTACREKYPFLKHWVLLVPMYRHSSECWHGVAVNKGGERVDLVYSEVEGLSAKLSGAPNVVALPEPRS